MSFVYEIFQHGPNKGIYRENQIATATVVGGGFIGLEMMENLVELGIQVQLIEMAPKLCRQLI